MDRCQVFCILLFCTVCSEALNITFQPTSLTLHMDETAELNYTVADTNGDNLIIYSENEDILTILDDGRTTINQSSGTFSIHAKFIGRTRISCKSETEEKYAGQVDIRIIREQTAVDTVFVATVATLVSIIYINFGCALDWNEPKKILKKPIGPIIGFCGQFVLMPLLAYGFGLLIFPNNPEMCLGLFFVGTSPGGGASNIWTALLDGNINLSVIMSAISTFSAFAMMPLWIFTLGKVIFESANLEVPYGQISTYVVGLVVPLAIGYLIQRYLKKVSIFMTKIMKAFASLLICFIIIFAIVTNLYLFEMFSWRIFLSGLTLSWTGYILGFVAAKILRQPGPDCIAIAVEVGVQNTGIAIFLLRVSLPQPEADLTTVVPVANAILTPIPLAAFLIYIKIRNRCSAKSKLEITESLEPEGKVKSMN